MPGLCPRQSRRVALSTNRHGPNGTHPARHRVRPATETIRTPWPVLLAFGIAIAELGVVLGYAAYNGVTTATLLGAGRLLVEVASWKAAA